MHSTISRSAVTATATLSILALFVMGLWVTQSYAQASVCQYVLHVDTVLYEGPGGSMIIPAPSFLRGSNRGRVYEVYEIGQSPNSGAWYLRVDAGWIQAHELDRNADCMAYIDSLVTVVPTQTLNQTSATRSAAQTATASAVAPGATATARASANAQATLERELLGPNLAGYFATTWSESAEYCLNSEIRLYRGIPGCWSDSTYARFHADPLSVFLFGPPSDHPLRGVSSSESATCVSSGSYLDVTVTCTGFGRTLYFHSSETNPGLPYFDLVDRP